MNPILKTPVDIYLKGCFVLVSLLMLSSTIVAQPFDVGHTSIEFYDSDRNRNIQTEIYYPAVSQGENVPIAAGSFPIIIFGHGFLMSWESYQNIWTEIVPNGYVICFPTTEMSISPSHENFGLDLKYVSTQMQDENDDGNSIFFNSLAQETGLMGHSMGGGASFLAAENNSDIHTLINFAAAETTPSAIAAASNISAPALIFSGDDDCVASPTDHQNLMYDNLSSNCKTQIGIINGGHCYFADENPACSFGESFCNSDLNITREEQQSVTNDFLTTWLDYSLKGNQNAFNVFNDSLQTSSRINFSQSCSTTSVHDLAIISDPIFYPNPATDNLRITIPKEKTGGMLFIYDLLGKRVHQNRIIHTNDQIDLSSIARGTYLLIYSKDIFSYSRKLIVI